MNITPQKIKMDFAAIIPPKVRYDERLTFRQRLMFGEIAARLDDEGYCYASNQHLATVYKTTTIRISATISKLVDYGYLKMEYTPRTRTRKIWIVGGFE